MRPMMDYQMRIQKLTIPKGHRIIITSDVHGRLSYLKGLLDKVNFSEEDYLLIAGDILEKGGESLPTLRYVMEFSKTHHVYTVCGNVDARAVERLENVEKFYKRYCGMMRNWGNCFYEEMLREQGLTLAAEGERSPQAQEMSWVAETLETEKELCAVTPQKAWECIRECYTEELQYICNLPFVIDAGTFLVTHAGISSDKEEDYAFLSPEEVKKMIDWDDFQNEELYFSKYVFVGHWPVTIYERAQMDSSPLINREKKIVSLDGGCAVKRDGQLNAVIMQDIDAEDFEIVSFDDFPVTTVLEDRAGSEKAFYVRWENRHVEKLETGEEETFVRFLNTGEERWIPNPYLWDEGEGLSCSDYTDYELPLKAGEQVSLLGKYRNGFLVRKDGVLGWYNGMIGNISITNK